MPLRTFGVLVAVALLTTGACQTKPPGVYATLERADSQTMEIVRSVLAKAMNRANIEIGPAILQRNRQYLCCRRG